MKDIGDKSSFFKNPIGVIGIFLVLTEAIAALVITNSSLNDWQNTILVVFIIVFPCLVLHTFYQLVTKHHNKLYSPSDYKDEQNFVNTYNHATQKEEKKSISQADECIEINQTLSEISILKDALSEVIEVQKKILPTIDSTSLSDDDKTGHVANMEGFLSEIEGEHKTLKVLTTPMYRCTNFVKELIDKGYLANVYRSSSFENKKLVSNANNEAIWLGNKVPLDMAIDVIKSAKQYYPHLKYIYLSDDKDSAPEYVKYQIYIGGASSTAIERNLIPLDKSNFEKIFTMKTLAELHEYIREFDPSN